MRYSLRILPMAPSHITACDAIVRASSPWNRLGEGVDFRAALRPNPTHTRAYVCLSGRDVAGFVLFISGPVFARGGYLRALGVDASFRGKGIGRMLLSFAEKKAGEQSRHFFLCVSSFNRGAQAFYRKCGYSRVGKLPDFLLAGASEYIFWKRLAKARTTRRSRP